MKIETIDDLISELQKIRSEKGNLKVAIDDADTSAHLCIDDIYQRSDCMDRILIEGNYLKQLK